MTHRRVVVAAAVAAGAIALAVLPWLTPRADAQQRVDVAGRYVLVNAEFTVTSDAGAKQATGLFKLDTQTGTAWRYTEHVRRDGEVRPRWIHTADRGE
jgi:hypothetical protein